MFTGLSAVLPPAIMRGTFEMASANAVPRPVRTRSTSLIKAPRWAGE